MDVAIRIPYQRSVSGPSWRATGPGERNTKVNQTPASMLMDTTVCLYGSRVSLSIV